MKLGRILFVFVIFATVAASQALGQEATSAQEAPKYWIVHFDQVTPDMATQYEDGLRAFVDAFKGAKLGPEWMWFTSMEPNFTYILVFPLKSFAEMDREEEQEKALEKALGKAKLEQLEKMVSPAIRTHHSEIVRHVEEMGYRPTNPAVKGQFYGSSHIDVEWVKPGKMEQYKQAAKQVKEAFAKVGHPFGYDAYQVMFGEGSYIYVTQTESTEQFYQNKFEKILTQALGKEGAAKLDKDWRECITRFEHYDATPRPDLSYLPTEPGQ